MSCTSTTVVSGKRAETAPRLSQKCHLATVGALAGAGILALGVIAAPPDSDGPRTEVRAVQLAATTLPFAMHVNTLEKLVGDYTRAGSPIATVAQNGNSDTEDPMATGQKSAAAQTFQEADAAALAAVVPTGLLDPLNAILGALVNNPIVGPIVLFAPIILGVIALCPPCALFNFVTFGIRALLLTFAEAPALPFVSLATEELAMEEKDPPVAVQSVGPRNEAVVSETTNTDVYQSISSSDVRTDTSRVISTELTTETELEELPNDDGTRLVTVNDDSPELGTDDLELTPDPLSFAPEAAEPSSVLSDSESSTDPAPDVAPSGEDSSGGGDAPGGDGAGSE